MGEGHRPGTGYLAVAARLPTEPAGAVSNDGVSSGTGGVRTAINTVYEVRRLLSQCQLRSAQVS